MFRGEVEGACVVGSGRDGGDGLGEECGAGGDGFLDQSRVEAIAREGQAGWEGELGLTAGEADGEASEVETAKLFDPVDQTDRFEHGEGLAVETGATDLWPGECLAVDEEDPRSLGRDLSSRQGSGRAGAEDNDVPEVGSGLFEIEGWWNHEGLSGIGPETQGWRTSCRRL